MLKLIHSRFSLDLTNYKISITEENFWFSDRFVAKMVLPITLELTDELNEVFGDLKSYASGDTETYFECKLYQHDTISDAIFEIEELEGRQATINIRYGLDELPNYNKKLSALPLEYIDLGATTIYDHAEGIFTQVYPDVNYNFVQVHTNKFNTEDDQWLHFQGIINKRFAGDFVENEYDAIEDEQVNRNIMQPQPYFLHVLKKGFEDAGYTLQGDILTDPEFKMALFSEISDYYTKITSQSQSLVINMDDVDTFYNGKQAGYSETLVLPEKGRYKIAGNLVIRTPWLIPGVISIKFNGVEIYKKAIIAFSSGTYYFQVDLNVDFISGAGEILVESFQSYEFTDVTGQLLTDANIADLTITQLAKFDVNGNPVSTLLVPTEIKLTECVPDMTFGEFVTILKNWKNFDLSIVGNTATMNYIDTQLIPVEVVDLKDFEIKEPRRIFHKGVTFVLKFAQENTAEYNFEKIFVSEAGVLSNEFVTNDDTIPIEIKAIPLPVVSKNGVITADHFVDDKTLLKAILYDGTGLANNLAFPADNLLISSVYDNHFATWLSTRIFGKGTRWSFIMTDEALREMKISSKVFCYEKNHIIKFINKDLISRGLWQVELELLALLE